MVYIFGRRFVSTFLATCKRTLFMHEMNIVKEGCAWEAQLWYIYAIKAIYSTIHSTSLDEEEMRKDTRKIWHVAGVYVGRTIFVSLRMFICVRYLNRFVTLKASVSDTEEWSKYFQQLHSCCEYLLRVLTIYQKSYKTNWWKMAIDSYINVQYCKIDC